MNTIPAQRKPFRTIDLLRSVPKRRPDEWFYDAPDSALDGVNEKDLLAIAYLLGEAFGEDFLPENIKTDMDWDGQQVVIWSEGPDLWTYFGHVPRNVREYATVRGLFLDAINHVVLGVYPSE